MSLRGEAESFAQRDHRDHLAAQVDDAFDEGRRIRDPREPLHADDFLDLQYLQAVFLFRDVETDQLQKFVAVRYAAVIFFQSGFD